MSRVLIVLGSGPGIGVGVASRFVQGGFDRVALISRNPQRLATDASTVSSAAAAASKTLTVKTYAVDVSESVKLEATLKQVVQDLGGPEVVVYNAARVGGGKFFEQSEESVDFDFKVRFPKAHRVPEEAG